jgi:hypothetical protein
MTTDPTTEPAPETVTDAVRFLQGEGYTANVTVDGELIRCASCGSDYRVGEVVAAHTFRFEGPSDPGDEAIVLGVEIPSCGAKGIIVSAYGPDADPELSAVVAALTG